jgi:hypothetical protein
LGDGCPRHDYRQRSRDRKAGQRGEDGLQQSDVGWQGGRLWHYGNILLNLMAL